ncbi:MAG: tetratricopeptide repeat protein [Rhodospirillaceae bacterium]
MTANTAALINTALGFHRTGNLAAAENAYTQALAADPENVDALHLLGVLLSDRGDARGFELMARAIALKPDMKEAHQNLANAYMRAERLVEAEHHFRRALALQPNDADAHNNLGGVLLRREQYTEAEACIARALKLQPDMTNALRNMGAIAEISGRTELALSIYDCILARHPDDADTRYQRAGLLLSLGRFAEGWIELTWRFKRREGYGMFGRLKNPYWQGEALAGRKIMIWTEQGLGEALILASMIPDALAQGAKVVLICPPRLVPLFRTAFPGIGLIATDGGPVDPALKADVAFQASVSELGRWLRPSFDAFPRKAYLKADPQLTGALRDKYASLAPGNRVVGISWRSRNPGAVGEKTPGLALWAPILRTPGVTFVSLQYGDCSADLAAVARDFGVQVFADPEIDSMKDLVGFAAQVAAMDLTISVSNTTVHFAGALGCPVWAMIPSNRGRPWHWFLGRDDSPWYPRLRLFRQDTAGSWEKVFRDVGDAMDAWRISAPAEV